MTTIFGAISLEMSHIHSFRVIANHPLPDTFSDGLVLYYSFDQIQDGQVVDLSGHERHGRIYNTEWDPNGKRGAAMQFNGSDAHMVASDHGLPQGDTPRSVAFWMKVRATHAPLSPLLYYGTEQWYQAFWVVLDWRNKRNGIGFSPEGAIDVASTQIVPDRWYHVVYTYEGEGRHSFYIDGQTSPHQVRELRGPVNTRLNGHMFVGKNAGPLFFDGWLDELMIYNRALTPDEVQALHGLHN